MTVDEIGKKLGVDKTVAYGLVRFLEEKGIMTRAGTRRPANGGKGKGTNLYTMSSEAENQLQDLVSDLLTVMSSNGVNEISEPVVVESNDDTADEVVETV